MCLCLCAHNCLTQQKESNEIVNIILLNAAAVELQEVAVSFFLSFCHIFEDIKLFHVNK